MFFFFFLDGGWVGGGVGAEMQTLSALHSGVPPKAKWNFHPYGDLQKHFLSGAALLTASNAALDAPATPTGTYQTASFGVPNPPSTPGSIARSCLVCSLHMVFLWCRVIKLNWLTLFFQIGCSPGFEDGDFDSSKVLRPAGSVYHDGEDCLYFVDTEVQSVLIKNSVGS